MQTFKLVYGHGNYPLAVKTRKENLNYSRNIQTYLTTYEGSFKPLVIIISVWIHVTIIPIANLHVVLWNVTTILSLPNLNLYFPYFRTKF